MSHDSETHEAPLSVEALRHIDRICVQYESAWRSGRRPSMEEYLRRAQGVERPKEGEFEESVEIDVDGALFFAEVSNPLREEAPYFWYGRANGKDRYCAVYFSSGKDRALSGVMYFEAQFYRPPEGEEPIMYLIGDWHGYCMDLDLPGRGPKDVTGKVIVYPDRDKDRVFKDKGITHLELPKP